MTSLPGFRCSSFSETALALAWIHRGLELRTDADNDEELKIKVGNACLMKGKVTQCAEHKMGQCT
jgi:hypothetical protein